MKQTAVEWLADRIQSDMTFIEVLGLIRQAKELEKQQIIDANNDGYKVGRKAKKFETAEQYYTETYKNE